MVTLINLFRVCEGNKKNSVSSYNYMILTKMRDANKETPKYYNTINKNLLKTLIRCSDINDIQFILMFLNKQKMLEVHKLLLSGGYTCQLDNDEITVKIPNDILSKPTNTEKRIMNAQLAYKIYQICIDETYCTAVKYIKKNFKSFKINQSNKYIINVKDIPDLILDYTEEQFINLANMLVKRYLSKYKPTIKGTKIFLTK